MEFEFNIEPVVPWEETPRKTEPTPAKAASAPADTQPPSEEVQPRRRRRRKVQTRSQAGQIYDYVEEILLTTPLGPHIRRYKSWKLRISHFLIFPVVFLYDELLLRIFNGTGLIAGILYTVLFAISAGFLCAALTSLFSRKINRGITIVILSGVSLFFAVECTLKNTYQTYMTVNSISAGTGDVVGGFTGDLVNAILGGLLAILLYALPVFLYVLLGRRRMPAKRRKLPEIGFMLGIWLATWVVGIATVYILSVPRNLYNGQFEYDTAVSTFGLITATRLDTKYSIFGNKAATTFVIAETTVTVEEADTEEAEEEEEEEEEVIDYGVNALEIDFDALIESSSSDAVTAIHQYVSSLTASSKNKYTGLFEGKNLIIITAEAFTSQVINEELTPTLYRLANNGIQFTDFYQPAWGGSTTTGEYSVLMGLVPTSGVSSILETIGCNLSFTIGNQLLNLGYTSLAFHNGEYTYYDRNLTHTNLGYTDFLAWGSGLDDLVTKWSGDNETITAILDNFLDEQPFSFYWMSYSGHCAYKSTDNRVTKNIDRVREVLGDQYEDATLYYFCYQLEFEYAMETLVSRLEEEGIADDTVIVICSDHYPYGLAESTTFGNTQDYLEDLYKDADYDKFTRDSNALIIWSGCLEGEDIVVDTPTMSLDILPTLLNLFGIDYDSRLLVGRDVFSDADPLVLWTDHSFVTEYGKYNAKTGVFTPNEGVTVSDDYVSTISAMVSNRISYSSQVWTYDYFEILFGS